MSASTPYGELFCVILLFGWLRRGLKQCGINGNAAANADAYAFAAADAFFRIHHRIFINKRNSLLFASRRAQDAADTGVQMARYVRAAFGQRPVKPLGDFGRGNAHAFYEISIIC